MADRTPDGEIRALTDLLESDGWALVLQAIEAEWGAEAYAARIDQALATARHERRSAEEDIGELGAAARAVKVLVKWPAERISQLRKSQEKPQGMFRRRTG